MLPYKDCDISVILSESLGQFAKEGFTSSTTQEEDVQHVKVISVFPRNKESFSDSLDVFSLLVLFIYREAGIIFGLGNSSSSDHRSRELEEHFENRLWFVLSHIPAYCLWLILNVPFFFFKACDFFKKNHEPPSETEDRVTECPIASSRRTVQSEQSHLLEERYPQNSVLRSKRGFSKLGRNSFENKLFKECSKKCKEALISPKTLVWDSNHGYVMVWSCLPSASNREEKGCLTLINLRDIEMNYQHENTLNTKTYAYGLSSVNENRLRKVKRHSNHLEKYDRSLINSVYYTCSTLPHVEDVNAIAVYYHEVGFRIALATEHGLRVWVCNTDKGNEDIFGSSHVEAAVDSVSEDFCNDCVFIEEKVIINPCSSQYAATTAVCWLTQSERIVAFVSTHYKTEMILIGRQTKGFFCYDEIWCSLLVSNLKSIFAGPLLRAFPVFLPSKKIIAVAVCPCRPFMACISNTADVILIDTQSWAYTHWCLSLHSDVVALPIIEWFSAFNDVTGFLCGTIHGLFQCILPCGRVTKANDVKIKALNFQFPNEPLKDTLDESSAFTLNSFSLDMQTGSRLAVILTAQATHNSYVFLFRYLPHCDAQPFVSYEGTLQYQRSFLKSKFRDIYQKYEPCCVSIGYTLGTISSSTWIAVAWRLFDAYGPIMIEYRFYIWHESIWLPYE